ncbi:MAG TPA: hypothetical protein VFJ62_06925, partial [Usitatibacter sp.]|nr:hypothetical protein [Usitatibacter sp.]
MAAPRSASAARFLSSCKDGGQPRIDISPKITNYQEVRRTHLDTLVTLAGNRTPAAAGLRAEALALFALPFNDLLFRAHTVHRENF